MSICDYKHDEIVYNGMSCPLCEANSDIFDLEEKVKQLESDISDLEGKGL